jgi:hypothetical protein
MLDNEEFNELDYINMVFSSEGSLSNLPDFANNITAEIKILDESISEAIQNQSEEGGQGKISMCFTVVRACRCLCVSCDLMQCLVVGSSTPRTLPHFPQQPPSSLTAKDSWRFPSKHKTHPLKTRNLISSPQSRRRHPERRLCDPRPLEEDNRHFPKSPHL